jgi:hypothetical protein
VHGQDLAWLSDGLEGRSANPVALLVDTLQRPNSDVDAGGAESSRLRWAHVPARARAHVVIGRGPPGGSWAAMHEELETVSYGEWMQLPGYPIGAWADDHGLGAFAAARTRLKRRHVARYYEDYVAHERLASHFLSGWQVVAMRRRAPVTPAAAAAAVAVSGGGSVSITPPPATVTLLSAPMRHPPPRRPYSPGFFGWAGAAYAALRGKPLCADAAPPTSTHRPASAPPDAATEAAEPTSRPAGWDLLLVEHGSRPSSPTTPGVGVGGTRALRVVRADHVVIATGMFDVPKRLGIPGEDLTHLVHHTATAAGKLVGPHMASPHPTKTAVVVGSGLSAADAILALRRAGVAVVHLFRHRSGTSPLAKCPRESYPEYFGLYREMRRGRPVPAAATATDGSAAYEPVQDGELDSVHADTASATGTVVWRDRDGRQHRRAGVAAVLVLIGSEPALQFLPPCLSSQTRRTSQRNPVAIDPYTFAWPGEHCM